MLKFKIDSLDGLDEGLKPLYAKGQDGKYTLQVDGDPAASALAKMKADLEAANAALKAAADEKDKKDREAEESRARATGDFEKLKEALKGTDADKIKDATESMQTASYDVFGKIYQQEAAQSQQAAGGQPGGEGEGPNAGKQDDNVVDADYEVVDEDEDKKDE